MEDDHHAWHVCLAWILCERRCSVMDLANWGGAKRCGFSGRGRGYAGLEEWNARVCAVRFCTGRNEVRWWMTAFVIGCGEQYAHSTPYPYSTMHEGTSISSFQIKRLLSAPYRRLCTKACVCCGCDSDVASVPYLSPCHWLVGG